MKRSAATLASVRLHRTSPAQTGGVGIPADVSVLVIQSCPRTCQRQCYQLFAKGLVPWGQLSGKTVSVTQTTACLWVPETVRVWSVGQIHTVGLEARHPAPPQSKWHLMFFFFFWFLFWGFNSCTKWSIFSQWPHPSPPPYNIRLEMETRNEPKAWQQSCIALRMSQIGF